MTWKKGGLVANLEELDFHEEVSGLRGNVELRIEVEVVDVARGDGSELGKGREGSDISKNVLENVRYWKERTW